jgi:drug/metabolite transporter (DMT)-like permease
MQSSESAKSSFVTGIIQLNLAILFISTSGVLGRYIQTPAPITIGLRAFLAGLALLAFCLWRGVDLKIDRPDIKKLVISGVLLGAHWVMYFYSLRLSNVAIGMLSLFTFPIITAILEPIFLKTKALKVHILLALLILVGVFLLVPEFSFDNSYTQAVIIGVFSAFCYSIRNILMKTMVVRYNGTSLMTYQLFIVTIFLSPLFLVLDTSEIITYLPETALLALLATAIGHTLFLYSFNHFSTISASIISCLQPIYGIIMGIIFLSEIPSASTILGGAIIITTVIIETIRVYKGR